MTNSKSQSDPESQAASDADARDETGNSTNLLMTGIVVRGATELISKKVEQHTGEPPKSASKRDLSKLDGKTILTTLGLYGASKLARRSFGGLAVVAGGLLTKTLYDRGKAKQMREHAEKNDDSAG